MTLYKFVGKKGKCYELDLYDSIKLNYRCKEGTIKDGSYECQATTEKEKKKYDKEYKIKTTGKINELKSKLDTMNARQTELHKIFSSKPTNIKYGTPEYTAWDNQPHIKAASDEYKSLTEPIMEAEKEIAYLNYKHPLVTEEFKPLYDNSYKILQNAPEVELKALYSYMNYTSKNANLMILNEYPNGEPIPEPKSREFDLKNNKYGYIENELYDLDTIVNKSKTPNDVILFAGISSSIYNNPDKGLLNKETEVRIPTFMSTSRSEKVSQQFASARYKKDLANHGKGYRDSKPLPDIPTYLEIHLKQNSRALSLERFQTEEAPDAEWTATKKDNQQEVLLGRNNIHTVRDIQISEFRGKTIRKIVVDSYNK